MVVWAAVTNTDVDWVRAYSGKTGWATAGQLGRKLVRFSELGGKGGSLGQGSRRWWAVDQNARQG